MFHLSYWERETYFDHIDIVIAGSGIVGLNSALNLKRKNPKLKIVILERGFLPYGASTRNAGFACFGSLSELIEDASKWGEQSMLEIVSKRFEGLKLLRKNLGDKSIDYLALGGFELFTNDDQASFEQCQEHLPDYNKLLADITANTNTYSRNNEKIAQSGFAGVEHIIRNECEGQVDTGKMMHALTDAVKREGVEIICGLEVTQFTSLNDGVELTTSAGFSITAGKLLICTNGFARQLLPEVETNPARAQVLITKPIDNLKIEGTFHYQQGYYYFRNVGNRLLFGGGRNLNFEGEHTFEFNVTQQIQTKLEELLNTVILPNTTYEVDMRWSGIMGLGSTKQSIVKLLQPNVYCAVRMGGMGVAIGSIIGLEAAQMILD
ncbi:MAG: FAD-binding oxidoreductase [Bacteroidetes bacterium]|nr:FAD-binding oxidoreductase [Bacteroidota bacterium]